MHNIYNNLALLIFTTGTYWIANEAFMFASKAKWHMKCATYDFNHKLIILIKI